MVALVSLVAVFGISLFTVRVATIALMYTGLARPVAGFQALSAFTGTGYTTEETESIVANPVRRRIVAWLMIFRSVGLVAAVAALAGSFVDAEHWWQEVVRLLMLLAAAVMLVWLTTVPIVDRAIEGRVKWAMKKWVGIDTRDYTRVLHLEEGHAIDEIKVQDHDDWLADRTLAELRLRDEGAVVIAVERRDGVFVSAPDGSTRLGVGDVVLMYGREERLAEIDSRVRDPHGEAAHKWAVREQRVAEEMEETLG